MPPIYPEASTEALENRREGHARTGTVTLRDFDKGVIETMGAFLAYDEDGKERNYFLQLDAGDVGSAKGRIGRKGQLIPPITPGQTALPGVPVVFSHPEDVFAKYDLPLIAIRRDDIDPATSRWHPGLKQYRAPAESALPTVVGAESYWNLVEEKEQAVPYDLTYTISILARSRGKGGISQTNQANAILHQVLKVYQPYCLVKVFDSIGDGRTYEAFQESISHLDEVPEVADRVIGFAVTLRVEAELDLNDPEVRHTVLSRTVGFEGI